MATTRRAFTLVEMLLALALTAVLTTIDGAIAVHSYGLSDVVRDEIAVRRERQGLLRAFESDLGGLLMDEKETVFVAGIEER